MNGTTLLLQLHWCGFPHHTSLSLQSNGTATLWKRVWRPLSVGFSLHRTFHHLMHLSRPGQEFKHLMCFVLIARRTAISAYFSRISLCSCYSSSSSRIFAGKEAQTLSYAPAFKCLVIMQHPCQCVVAKESLLLSQSRFWDLISI